MPLSSPDVIIALMGVTGAGKSSLIRLLTQDDSVRIGHSLTSETTEIQQYRLHHRGRNYVLVDTPGFDDTYRANTDIVTDLLSWLTTSFRAGTRLNGILYLHRVSDIRMTGSAFENLRMFRNLVGDDALSNVILVTTFWDTVSFDVGEEREMELMRNKQFWGRMMDKGCKVWRLRDRTDRSKALSIIESVSAGKFTLQAQREIVVEGRTFHDTSAVREIAQATIEFERKLSQERARAKADLLLREAQEKKRIQEEKDKMTREAQERQRMEASFRRYREERQRREFEAEQERLLEEARREEQEMQERYSRLRAEYEAEQRRAEEEQRRMREEYYRNYRCVGKHVSKHRLCDRCRRNIHEKWKYYYHCCHCDNDDWNQCGDCGCDCGVQEHPVMEARLTKDVDDCLIM